MTPVRAAAIVRGDVPGLLRRGMPVLLGISFGDDDEVEHIPGVLHHVEEDGDLGDGADTIGYYHDARIGRGRYYSASLTIDWSDTLAVYAALHWLAEKGHPGCLWMLPTTHGGRVEAWDGLTAWEVSAIVVSSEVALRAAGRPGIACVARAYGIPTNTRMSMDRIGRADVYWTATEADRDYFVAPTRLGHDTRATPDHPGWLYTPRLGFTSYGPEVGAEAVARINECALANGCALLVPGGIATPNL